MAVTTASITQPYQGGSSSNASFKAWGSAISGLLSGAGLVQTADTGQINWGTTAYTHPAGSFVTTTIGYEVWRFDDALQASAPVFIKARYFDGGNGSQPAFEASVWFSIGTGTDGAGTLTGLVSSELPVTPFTYTNGFNLVTGASACWSSGDGSYMTLALGWDTTQAFGIKNNGGLGCFYVDRTRDSSGATTADGVVFGGTGAGGIMNANTSFSVDRTGLLNAAVFSVMNFTAASVIAVSTGTTNNTGVLLPGYVPGTLSSSTTIGLDAPAVIVNQKEQPPILAALSYWGADIAKGATITVPVSGANHTYFCLGDFAPCADRAPAQSSVSLAMRYE